LARVPALGLFNSSIMTLPSAAAGAAAWELEAGVEVAV
jgi:hypothetical protein